MPHDSPPALCLENGAQGHFLRLLSCLLQFLPGRNAAMQAGTRYSLKM